MTEIACVTPAETAADKLSALTAYDLERPKLDSPDVCTESAIDHSIIWRPPDHPEGRGHRLGLGLLGLPLYCDVVVDLLARPHHVGKLVDLIKLFLVQAFEVPDSPSAETPGAPRPSF